MPDKLFSLITGPGSHSFSLIRALQTKFSFDYTEYWPHYNHMASDEKGMHKLNQSVLFDSASWLAYGLQNRLRLINRRKWHQDMLFPLYDRINRKNIKGRNLIAWPQVSYLTMRKIKEEGGRIILEQPMCHVDFWNETSKREHEKLGVEDDLCFSVAMTARIKKEYELANQIVALSSFAKGTLVSNGIPENKIVVHTPGINIPPAKERHANSRFRVLYVGRVEVLKGVVALMKVLAPLSDKLEFHLAGAVQDSLKKTVANYQHKFVFHGPVNRSELNRLYQIADVVVFPSLYDSLGLVILEAMSHGIPVIASTHSGGRDIIRDYEHGFVLEPDNSDAWIEKIVWMMEHRHEAEEMGMRARVHIMQNYSHMHYAKMVTDNANKIFV
jgi:glycosyltransferase involved in cell wall biosynthesis